jgi:hypothetical protein
MPRPTIAVIDWLDASFTDGPLALHDVKPLIRLQTVGWLIHEDGVSITVAQERAEEDGRYRAVQSIPKVNVVRVRKVKVP